MKWAFSLKTYVGFTVGASPIISAKAKGNLEPELTMLHVDQMAVVRLAADRKRGASIDHREVRQAPTTASKQSGIENPKPPYDPSWNATSNQASNRCLA